MADRPRGKRSAPAPGTTAARKQEAMIERVFRSAAMATAMGGYDAARPSRARRDRTRGVGSGDYHADRFSRESMRAAARDMLRNSPLYRAMITRLVDLVVGPGMRPQADSGDQRWNQLAEAEFMRWFSRPIDVRGQVNGLSAQRLALTETFVAGDLLVIKTDTGLVQFVESERVTSRHGAPNDGEVDGVVLDRVGRPTRYLVANWGPYGGGDSRSVGSGGSGGSGGGRTTGGAVDETSTFLLGGEGAGIARTDVVSVDAAHAIWLMHSDRPSQTRGTPIAAAAMNAFQDLDEYVDAHVRAAKIQAFLAAAIISNNPGALRHSMAAGSPDGGGERDPAAGEAGIAPGSLLHLGAGEDIKLLTAGAPSQAFDSFSRALLTQCCAAVGLPMEYALLSFGGMNYSSSRSAMLTAKIGLEHHRRWFASSFLEPLWRWRMARLISEGRVPYTERWDAVRWASPPLGWVDPTKEVEGYAGAVRARLISPQQAVSMFSGADWREVLQQTATFARECELLGIPADPTDPPGSPGSEIPGIDADGAEPGLADGTAATAEGIGDDGE